MTKYIDIDGSKGTLRIIEERRNGARVALGGTHVILRVPKVFLFGSNIEKHVEWAKKWLVQLKATKPQVLDRYLKLRKYVDGETFAIGGQNFLLKSRNRQGERVYQIIEGRYFENRDSRKVGYDRQKLLRSLIIKFAQKYFLADITKECCTTMKIFSKGNQLSKT
ncbi:MAG: hypothetical protein IPL08_06895 [Saprospiraceae bacterium]|nr:hypothetical protein [Saprospiraceae bacterium]